MLRAFIMAASGCDVGLAADNGLDPVLDRGLIEFNGPEKIAVIGHAKRRHFIFSGFLDEFFDAAGPIEEAVLRVDVQMNKIGMIHCNRKKTRLYGRG